MLHPVPKSIVVQERISFSGPFKLFLRKNYPQAMTMCCVDFAVWHENADRYRQIMCFDFNMPYGLHSLKAI